MTSFASRVRLQEEAGFSLVELLVTMIILGIVMGGLANIFVSGERASSDGTARLTSQQNVRLAFGRLEFDARCASSASLISSGAGVALTLPTQCAHATGNVAWCVTSGALTRLTGTTCTGSALTYVTDVTSPTPFSCYSPVTGSTPQLEVNLTVNPTNRSENKTTATDYITMRNASSTGCS